jgi:hypothetical protein
MTNDCGADDGMRIGKENASIRRNHSPVHDLNWD